MLSRFLSRSIAGSFKPTASTFIGLRSLQTTSAKLNLTVADVTRTTRDEIIAHNKGKEPDHWLFEATPSNLPSTWPAKPCEFQDYTMVKEGEKPKGPQSYYPDLKYHLPYDTSKYRCFLIPEAFFNFLYERTGVLGPYFLLWGGFLTLWSKEILIINEEFGAAAMWFILPIYPIAYKLGPKIDRKVREDYNSQMLTLETLKKCKIEQFANEADALVEDSTRAEAGKEVFQAYEANADNMIEAEYRQRQERVFEAFKRRLDYQVALQSLEESVVQKQLVAWVKQEAEKAIQARPHTDIISQCLTDLKQLASSAKA